ncbi:hypothetical protein ABZ070_02715 [Streptomyces sp. NPDC006283]|uniref:hypothetical protein n=1 Tax=Streptomyces sp. NPDC006283 TaxID=3156741 RepID=UPI0033A7EAF4
MIRPSLEDREAGPDRREPLRRFLRHRTARAAVAAGLVGALLGAGLVAWSTDALPSARPAPCWDSLSDSAVSGLFGDRRLEVDEQALRRDPGAASLSYGQCRITSFKGEEARRQAIVRVHTLDGLYGTDGRRWPAEFLSSRMVALGDGLPGMVTPSRAWLALPRSCTGKPGENSGSTVVDVTLGERDLDMSAQYDEGDRDAMARVVVDAANGVIREMGCSGRYRVPAELPAVPDWRDVQVGAFCGVKGLELPTAYRDTLRVERAGGDGGSARVCETGRSAARVRLLSVVDPGVNGIFSWETTRGGPRIRGTRGDGTLNPTRGVYRLRCGTERVVFVVEDLNPHSRQANLVRDLLPRYVRAETERIGCGREEVSTTPLR